MSGKRGRGLEGTHVLGKLLVKEIKKRQPVVRWIGLADITANMGLDLHGFGFVFPAGSYLVDELFGADTEEVSGGGGEASFANHAHQVRAPLAPGDLVYVELLDAHTDAVTPIVVGRIAP